MPQKGKLEQLGGEAQKKAIKLSVEGLANQSIADELNKDNGTNLSSEDVRNFLRRKQFQSAILLKEDKNFQNKLVQQYFDTVEQLKTLNAEMWKFFYEIRKDPEYTSKQIFCPKCNHKFRVQLKSFGTLLKTADVLLNQIRHVDIVLGKMQKKSLNINYNYVDLSKKIGIVMPNLLEMMERKGIIKLNKKRLKLYYGGKKVVETEEVEDEEEDSESEEEEILA